MPLLRSNSDCPNDPHDPSEFLKECAVRAFHAQRSIEYEHRLPDGVDDFLSEKFRLDHGLLGALTVRDLDERDDNTADAVVHAVRRHAAHEGATVGAHDLVLDRCELAEHLLGGFNDIVLRKIMREVRDGPALVGRLQTNDVRRRRREPTDAQIRIHADGRKVRRLLQILEIGVLALELRELGCELIVDGMQLSFIDCSSSLLVSSSSFVERSSSLIDITSSFDARYSSFEDSSCSIEPQLGAPRSQVVLELPDDRASGARPRSAAPGGSAARRQRGLRRGERLRRRAHT